MELRNMKLTSVCLLLTCILQAFSAEIQTTEAPLLCYVCENCAEETQYAETMTECNESFFAPTTVSVPTTTETTPAPTTPIPTEADTSTNPPTTTPIPTTSSTVDTTTGESTEAPPPTPPTAGPVQTTTAMPTPPNPGTVIEPIDDNTNLTRDSISNSTSQNSTESTPATVVANGFIGGRSARQLRQAADPDVTFHCYRAVVSVNGSLVTQRGCSRVTTMEAVCSQVQQMNNDTKVNKCFACSESLCNGSRALAVSAVTLLFAVLAALLHRN